MVLYTIYAHGMSDCTYIVVIHGSYVRCGTGGTRQTLLGIQQIFTGRQKKIHLYSAVVVVAGQGGVSRGERRKGIAMLKSKIKY